MFFRLEPHDYARGESLFAPMHDHLAVRAVLAGKFLGEVYVDDAIHPRAGIVIVARRRFYLAGDAHNVQFNLALQQFFAETVYPQAIQAGKKLLGLYFEPSDWAMQMSVILKNKNAIQPPRYHFLLKRLEHDWRDLLPSDFSIRLVDRALLADMNIRGLDELTQEMQSERASVGDFLDQSFGVCLIHDNAVAGFCLSEYNVGDACEVGIETHHAFRKRGLATAMASALIEHALARGVKNIGWHCYASNLASVATAQKIGFEKVRDYTIFQAWYDEPSRP